MTSRAGDRALVLLGLGYTNEDLARLHAACGERFEAPEDIQTVLDSFGYLEDWRAQYRVKSVRTSLHEARITCIDAAILAYGLLDGFPAVERRLLAIHRRSPAGEECGHVVTLYRGEDGLFGAFSKSSFAGLDHREAIYPDAQAVARSYAEAYLRIGLKPLYYGVTTLEQAANELDWRFHPGELNVLSERIQESYEYAFETS